MTLDEIRENTRRCWDEAISEIRAAAWADCGGPPLSYREVEAALSRAARRLPAARPGDAFPGSEL